VVTALVAAPRLCGDSREYLLTTESWLRHRDPAAVPGDLEALGRMLPDREPLRNHRLSRGGRLYGTHFWAYTLSGLPARALLGVVGGSPLHALPLTNAVWLTAAVAAVLLGLPWRMERRLLFAGLILGSPLLGFLLWPHPEVFAFSLVVLAFVGAERGRWILAALAVALAASQNPPLIVLCAALLLRAILPALRDRKWGDLAGATAVAALALLPAAFFRWNFGVFNMSVLPSEARQSFSILRSFDLLFDLNLGLLPYLPVTLLLFIGRAVGDLLARRWSVVVVLGGLLLAMAWACTGNINWNNGTTGPSRYAVWLLPLVLFGVARPAAAAASSQWTVALTIALAVQGGVTLARGGFFSTCDYLEHSYAARFVLDRWPRLYRPLPEVFAERTTGQEIQELDALVVYRSAGRCRKALARWRHAEELEALCGPHPPAWASFFQTRPPGGRDAKRTWVYVDY
jgi:hypothetical protein